MVHNSPETTTGGKALKFYASVRLDSRRIETLKDGTDAVGNRTRVKVVKNKFSPPFKVAEFDILYGIGISREGSLIDLGVEQGIVRKAGAWYTYDGDQLGQGKENARTFLRDNPDVANEIEKKIKEKLGVGPRSTPTSRPSPPEPSSREPGRRGQGHGDAAARRRVEPWAARSGERPGAAPRTTAPRAGPRPGPGSGPGRSRGGGAADLPADADRRAADQGSARRRRWPGAGCRDEAAEAVLDRFAEVQLIDDAHVRAGLGRLPASRARAGPPRPGRRAAAAGRRRPRTSRPRSATWTRSRSTRRRAPWSSGGWRARAACRGRPGSGG